MRIVAVLATLVIGAAIAAAQHNRCGAAPSEVVRLARGPLSVHKVGSAVQFRAGMTVDADGAPKAYGPGNKGLDYTANAMNGAGFFVGVVTGADGMPVLQRLGSARGYYVSSTSLHDARGKTSSPSTYVDASTIPYIALPSEIADRFGIVLGDLAVVRNEENGKAAFAIFADIGPRGKVGEGSMALAKAMGLKSSPRDGGTAKLIISYLIFPNSGLGSGKLRTRAAINASANEIFRRWGGAKRMNACLPGKKTSHNAVFLKSTPS